MTLGGGVPLAISLGLGSVPPDWVKAAIHRPRTTSVATPRPVPMTIFLCCFTQFEIDVVWVCGVLRSRLMTKTKLVMSASKPRTKSQPTVPGGVPDFVASRAMSTMPIVKESSAEAIAVRKNGRAFTHAHAAEGSVATLGWGCGSGWTMTGSATSGSSTTGWRFFCNCASRATRS